MKTIWVVQYIDGTADVFDKDQGPPSWPYVDAFVANRRIAKLERKLSDVNDSVLKTIDAAICDFSYMTEDDTFSNGDVLERLENIKAGYLASKRANDNDAEYIKQCDSETEVKLKRCRNALKNLFDEVTAEENGCQHFLDEEKGGKGWLYSEIKRILED